MSISLLIGRHLLNVTVLFNITLPIVYVLIVFCHRCYLYAGRRTIYLNDSINNSFITITLFFIRSGKQTYS